MTHPPDETLIALADGELTADAAAAARAHVDGCASCAARLARVERASSDVQTVYERLARTRGRVRVAVAIALTAASVLWLDSHAAPMFPSLSASALQMTTLPVRHLTPGAVRPIEASDVCREGRERGEIDIPAPVRRIVLRNYGARALRDDEYELDYLITPELGGAADPRNLWPERYSAPVWNARVKDELEDLLHRLVCSGTISLASAQRDMATNWIVAYQRYFHTQRPGGWPAGLPSPIPLIE